MTSVDDELRGAAEELDRATHTLRELRRAWPTPKDVSTRRSQRALDQRRGT